MKANTAHARGQNFTLQPTDYMIGPASGNPNMCLTWPRASQPTPDGVDWQLGTFCFVYFKTCTYSCPFSGSTFLRSVYTIYEQVFDPLQRIICSNRSRLATASTRKSPLPLGCMPSTIKPLSNRTIPFSLPTSRLIPQPLLQHFPTLYFRRRPTRLLLTPSIPLSRLNQGKLCCLSLERAPTRPCLELCLLLSRQRCRR
jgi:hypothetical protein